MHEEWTSRCWRVALVAHDAKKAALVDFVNKHNERFAGWSLVATQATGRQLRRETGLAVRCLLAGPYGGDVQIGAEIAAGEIDGLIFLRDPLTAQPHEPDITALLRLADLHEIPVATNLASAECLVKSLVNEPTEIARS